MKKNISEGFKFPSECPLNQKEKTELLDKFRKQAGKLGPFALCKQSKWIDCPGRVHLECFALGGQQKK